MLQILPADEFKLLFHKEIKEAPVYEISIPWLPGQVM
jgi:uncharacterized protein (TIGR03435 family)